MPAFRHELGTEDGGDLAAAVFHQLQQIPLLLIRSRDQKEFIKYHKWELLKLLHHLVISSLYPCCFQFAEQFRQTDISGLISGLAGVDSQCISNKAFAGTCSPDQDDIQPLADVVIIRQALQKIPVQMPVRQIINVMQMSQKTSRS